MAEATLQCFKNSAIQFLQDEITSGENAKISIGNISLSANKVTSDAVGALLSKGPRAAAKSIEGHVTDFASNTVGYLSSISTEVTDQLNGILSGSNLSGLNVVDDLVGTTFKNLLVSMTGNSGMVYGLAKNASKKAAKDASARISTSNSIINIINEIREVRTALGIPQLVKEPIDAATEAASALDFAKNLLDIVLSGFASTQPGATPAQIPRREGSYNRSVEAMSDGLDALKIGTGSFKLTEYLKLRLDFKVLITKFRSLDIDIQESVINLNNAETEYDETKEDRAAIEGSYVQDVRDKIGVLLEQMETAIARGNDAIALDNFENWSKDLLTIYTLAHTAFDRDIDVAVSDAANPDKIAYSVIATTYGTLQPQIEASELADDMTFLAELYFNVLRSSTFTEADVRIKEDAIKSSLTTLSQLDQQVVNANTSYGPTVIEILLTIASLTKLSGLDKLASAVSKGSVSGFFGLITENLGSSASKAAGCLSGSIVGVANSEIREILLRTNATIQATQRTKQIAGSVRESFTNRATNSINARIQRITELKAELEGLQI